MRNKSRFSFVIFFFLICVQCIFISCEPGKKESDVSQRTQLDTRADIKYAKGFNLAYYSGFKVLKIYTVGRSVSDTAVYLLLPHKFSIPKGFSGAQVIRTPVKSLIALSSSHIALAEFSGAISTIKGLGNLNFVTNKEVLTRVAAGEIKEIGDESSINNELLIQMKPDVVMATANMDAALGKYNLLSSAGIPVVVIGDWLEDTPLAKAEWVKVMAALVNTDQKVAEKFSALEKEYNTLAQAGRKAANKPNVIIGLPFKDIWYVPAGESAMAKFLEDAGATYNWATDKGTGSLALNFESVVPVALKADFWINPGTTQSKAELNALDSRYSQFKPFRNNKIFNNNRRSNAIGTNDFWESGTVNPQVVLADLIRIFHPDLLPHHELYFFKAIN